MRRSLGGGVQSERAKEQRGILLPCSGEITGREFTTTQPLPLRVGSHAGESTEHARRGVRAGAIHGTRV